MQIIFISEIQFIILCFILWAIFQVGAALLCMKIPEKYLSPMSFLFREHTWEREGKIYKKIFHVIKWKKFLPDGGTVIKGGYKKRHLENFSEDNLNKFLVESCRAELVHIVAILPFWVFGLFAPPIVILIMFLYAVAVNLPCVIVQRYNRPRIIKIMGKLENMKVIEKSLIKSY